MKRINTNKFVTTKRKNESVEDLHELLLSLVDMGSLDTDEALLACVQEMSDAECKHVLSSLSLSNCCDDHDEVAVEDTALESSRHIFEGLHPDMLRELQMVFDNNFGSPSYYGSDREFQLEMEGLADGTNDMMVSDAIQCLCDEFGYDADRLESVRDDIADDLSQMAQVLLDNMDISESKKCKLESRIKRLERLLNK